jgi:hypothetical protein
LWEGRGGSKLPDSPKIIPGHAEVLPVPFSTATLVAFPDSLEFRPSHPADAVVFGADVEVFAALFFHPGKVATGQFGERLPQTGWSQAQWCFVFQRGPEISPTRVNFW